MNKGISSLLLVITVFFLAPGIAVASAGASNRYYITTNRAFWRNAMSARHVFSDGFTADLSDLQVRIAKLAGLKPIPVKKYYILSDVQPSSTPTPRMMPTQGVPWGVSSLIGDSGKSSSQGGSGVSIAILDTGVDREHPDLKGVIDGCFDVTDPVKAFLDNQCDDGNGHGTHMAGVISANGGINGKGIYGFAPQASISAYRVCASSGVCLSDDIAVAITHAVDEGANIVLLGMGGEAQSSMISDAIGYATDHDVMIVAPAGNDGPYKESIDWPARDSRVVSVGAIDSDDHSAEFSSRGFNETTESYVPENGDIEFAAPGVNIESTFRDGGYAILSGSSMAAPHVVGLAALVWQRNARLESQATRTYLHELSRDIGPIGDDSATGWGVPRLPSR